MTTDFNMSTNPTTGVNCVQSTTISGYTTNGMTSTLTVTNTWLQSTFTSVSFDDLTNCSQTGSELMTSSGDKLENYDEYWVAVFINKYYLYVIVGLGLPGNLAALITIFHMKPFASSSVYMAVLACVDSVNLVIKIIYLQLTLHNVRIFDVGCKLIFFLGTFAMHFANWILVAMTIERFIAIWFPLKVSEICTKKKALSSITCIAIVLSALNLHFLWSSYEDFHPKYQWDCKFKKEFDYFMENMWYWIDGAAYAFLPFVALVVFNILIVIGINSSVKTQEVLTNKHTKDKMKQQQQITVMLFTVSVVFVLLTMPNCIFFIYKYYWDYLTSVHDTAVYYLLYQVVFVLSDLNHAINFYLYFLSGKKFRMNFKAIICCLGQNRMHRGSSTMTTKMSSSRNTRLSLSVSANSLTINPSPSSQQCPSIGDNGQGTAATSVNGSTLSLSDMYVRSDNERSNGQYRQSQQ